MHELNISCPLSLARFFWTQQRNCKSKIEKQNISLDIFLLDTSEKHLSTWRNNILATYDRYPFLWIRFRYLFVFFVLPAEVDKKWGPVFSGNLMVKSRLPPQGGSSLEAVEHNPWKRAIRFVFFFFWKCNLGFSKIPISHLFYEFAKTWKYT